MGLMVAMRRGGRLVMDALERHFSLKTILPQGSRTTRASSFQNPIFFEPNPNPIRSVVRSYSSSVLEASPPEMGMTDEEKVLRYVRRAREEEEAMPDEELSDDTPIEYLVYMGIISEDESEEVLKEKYSRMLSSVIPIEERERASPFWTCHLMKGFSAMLTKKEAALLSGHEEVISVMHNNDYGYMVMRNGYELDTDSSEVLRAASGFDKCVPLTSFH